MVGLRLAPGRNVDSPQCKLKVSLAGLVILRLDQCTAAPELLDLILSLDEVLNDLLSLVESHKGELSIAEVRLVVLPNTSSVGQVGEESRKSLVDLFQGGTFVEIVGGNQRLLHAFEVIERRL